MQANGCLRLKRISGVVASSALLGLLAANAPAALGVTPRCYFPGSLQNCSNATSGGYWGGQASGYLSPPVFAGNTGSAFYNNQTSGTPKKQLHWLRPRAGVYNYWFDVATSQAGRLWYVPHTSNSYVLAKCQNTGGGNISAQCGQELLVSYAWVNHPG